jgi:hypothetical protein
VYNTCFGNFEKRAATNKKKKQTRPYRCFFAARTNAFDITGKNFGKK